MRRFIFLLLGMLALASPLPAQVVVGEVTPNVVAYVNPASGMATAIDFNHPATADGNLTTATVRWGAPASACTNAFKIRVFRDGGAYGSFNMVGDRGPFSSTSTDLITVSLTPPLPVHKDDLIGVALLAGPACGGLCLDSGNQTDLAVVISGDFTGGAVPSGAALQRRTRLSVRASSEAQALVGILPVAGQTPGTFGASFRSTFEVTNTGFLDLQGSSLVFHPAGTIGSLADFTLSVPLPPYGSKTYDLHDLFPSPALGSIDVYSKSEYGPQVAAHVFNEAPTGTNGFDEPMIPRQAALQQGESAFIALPPSFTDYRVNVGLRTLENGATIRFTVWTPDGHQAVTVENSYPPDYFLQPALQDLVGILRVPVAGGSIQFQVSSGEAIFYTTTTDNRTNDSAITVARRR